MTAFTVPIFVILSFSTTFLYCTAIAKQHAQPLVAVAFGGTTNVTDDAFTTNVESFNLDKNGTHNKNLAPMPNASSYFGSTMYNNTIYVAGGYEKPHLKIADHVWSYDIDSNTWSTDLPQLPYSSYGPLVAFQNALYHVDSYTNGLYRLNLTTTTPPENAVWEAVEDKWPGLFISHMLNVGDKNLYVTNSTGAIFSSSDAGKTWQAKPAPPKKLEGSTFEWVVLQTQDSIMFVDAFNDTTAVQIYNISDGTWRGGAAPMPTGRFGLRLATVPGTSLVLACGGVTLTTDLTDVCDMYDWYNDAWKANYTKMNKPRTSFGLQVLVVANKS